jgi:hypothetical protein
VPPLADDDPRLVRIVLSDGVTELGIERMFLLDSDGYVVEI